MNAASRDKLGAAPAAANLMADALREKHRRSRGGDPEDAPASEPEGTGEGEPEPGGTPERAPVREPALAPALTPSRAPEREHARKGERRGTPEEPETGPEARTQGSEGSRPADVPGGQQEGSQAVAEPADGELDEGLAVLWELDQATRSYLAGLKKLAPRKTRLAEAVAAYLEAGGSPADIRSRFAAIGIPGRDIPTEIQEVLKRPTRP